MPESHQLVVFSLDEQRYALALGVVERIVRTVEITPVPGSPEIVLGVINVQGRIVPVIDIRKRFRLPARELQLSDQILIAHTSKRGVALVVDTVTGVVGPPGDDVVTGEAILPHLQYVSGALKRPDGVILIHDLERFLALEEEQALHQISASLTP